MSSIDLKVLKGLVDQDEGAWRIVYQTFFNQLFYFAHQMVGNPEIARDLVQDMFVSVYSSPPKLLNDYDHLNNYLFQAVRFVCLNFLRSRSKAQAYMTEISDTWSEEYLSWPLELEAEFYDLVREKITDLPEQEREILAEFINGSTVKEIAQKLQITPNYIGVAKTRAMEKLRTYFKQNSR